MLSRRALVRSVRYAVHGVGVLWREEHSFRVQVVIAIGAVVGACALRVSLMEMFIIVCMSVIVLSLEMLNSVVERIADLYAPRIIPVAGDIKDIMAGAVLIASCGALAVGFAIFWGALNRYFPM